MKNVVGLVVLVLVVGFTFVGLSNLDSEDYRGSMNKEHPFIKKSNQDIVRGY